MTSLDAVPLGIYVHWPYCARICPYCDFNVYRDRGADAAAWAGAFRAEITAWAERLPGRRATSLYFGGGTPSLAPLAATEAAIDAVASTFGFEPAAEITLEANPTDAEGARFDDLRRVGINRLSLGVQSLRDDALAFLGRNHDARSARAALARALETFGNVSFDLIYGRPGQTADDWRRELAEALAFGAPHLSLYQLTIEPGTAFSRAVERGRWVPVGDDLEADLYDLAGEMTLAAGLPAYEVSNHARPGAASAHNRLYWRGGDYVGVGPGAHGRLTIDGARLALVNAARPGDYLARIAAGANAVADEERLTREAEFAERLAMGLRLVEGVELPASFTSALDAITQRIDRLEVDGLLHREGLRLTATAAGRRVLNSVLAHLLT